MSSPTWGDMSTGTGQGGLAPAPLNAPSSPGVQVGIQPGASTGIFIGHLVIVGGSGSAVSGIFVYSGTPAHGNPPILSITNSTSDPFGNTVTPSLTLSGLPFLVYTGAPAAGNLFLSAAETTGTDAFGNTYQTGYQVHGVGAASAANIEITTFTGGVPFAFWSTGVSEESTSASISATILNPGASEQITWFLAGPRIITHTAYVYAEMIGSAKDGSVGPEGLLVWVDGSAVQHELLTWGPNGLQVQSLFSGDSNNYQTERLSFTLASNLVINTTGGQAVFSWNIGVGTYIVDGVVKLFPTAAAGQPQTFFSLGGGAAATISVEVIDLFEGTPGSLSNVGTISAFSSFFAGGTMGGGGRSIQLKGTMIVSTAGAVELAMATSAVADTFTITALGTYLNVYPVGE